MPCFSFQMNKMIFLSVVLPGKGFLLKKALMFGEEPAMKDTYWKEEVGVPISAVDLLFPSYLADAVMWVINPCHACSIWSTEMFHAWWCCLIENTVSPSPRKGVCDHAVRKGSVVVSVSMYACLRTCTLHPLNFYVKQKKLRTWLKTCWKILLTLRHAINGLFCMHQPSALVISKQEQRLLSSS